MTAQPPLIPRQPRKMLQPRKSALREVIALLTDELIRLQQENESLRRPWWRRLFGGRRP